MISAEQSFATKGTYENLQILRRPQTKV